MTSYELALSLDDDACDVEIELFIASNA